MSNIAYLDWALDVECPHCHEEVNLVDVDDRTVSNAIFDNRWDDLKDYKVTCDHCGFEFTLDRVEY